MKSKIELKLKNKIDIKIPLPNSYSPKFTEACWYGWWEKQVI